MPQAVTENSRLLARLMKGERLTLDMALRHSKRNRAAVRRGLQAMVDAIPHARRSRPGRGTAEEFWWVWPAEQRSCREEVWALAMARALLEAFSDSEIGRVLDALVQDHAARLGDGASAGDLSRKFYPNNPRTRPNDLNMETLDMVAQATALSNSLAFDYKRFDGQRFPCEFQPWTLVLAEEGAYVYGLRTDRDQRRLYRVSRIENVCQRGGFVYPTRSTYDPATLFEYCWGLLLPPDDSHPEDVVLKFSPTHTNYLASHSLHPTQAEPEVGRDGHSLVRMHLHLTYDLVRWIRGLGNEVEVLHPVRLGQWVASGEGLGWRPVDEDTSTSP